MALRRPVARAGAFGRGASDDAALGAPGDAALRDAPAIVVATAVFRRTGHKYRDSTYRYVLADLGHAMENLRVASGAVGAGAMLRPAFDQSRVAATLGVDESEEGVRAMVALLRRDPQDGAALLAAPRWRPAPVLTEEASALGVPA